MYFWMSGRGFGPGMWIVLIIAVIAIVLVMNGGSGRKQDLSPSTRLVSASPKRAIEKLMETYRSAGWPVEEVRVMEPKSDSVPNAFIFEYNVTDPSGGEPSSLIWEWTVPAQLVFSDAARKTHGNEQDTGLSDQQFEYLLGQATLLPLTESAERNMERLQGFIDGGK